MKKEIRDNFIEKKRKKKPSQAIVSLSMIKKKFTKYNLYSSRAKNKNKNLYIYIYKRGHLKNLLMI